MELFTLFFGFVAFMVGAMSFREDALNQGQDPMEAFAGGLMFGLGLAMVTTFILMRG